MAEQNVSQIPNRALAILEAIIEGKVQSIEQPKDSEWTYYTVQLKARDEYSAPGSIQISQPASQRPFSRVDEVIKVKVALGGYGRRYNGNLYVTNTLTYVENV